MPLRIRSIGCKTALFWGMQGTQLEGTYVVVFSHVTITTIMASLGYRILQADTSPPENVFPAAEQVTRKIRELLDVSENLPIDCRMATDP